MLCPWEVLYLQDLQFPTGAICIIYSVCREPGMGSVLRSLCLGPKSALAGFA